LLGVWFGNDCSVQTYAGQAGSLSRLLSEAGQKRTSRTGKPNGPAIQLTGVFSSVPWLFHTRQG